MQEKIARLQLHDADLEQMIARLELVEDAARYHHAAEPSLGAVLLNVRASLSVLRMIMEERATLILTRDEVVEGAGVVGIHPSHALHLWSYLQGLAK